MWVEEGLCCEGMDRRATSSGRGKLRDRLGLVCALGLLCGVLVVPEAYEAWSADASMGWARTKGKVVGHRASLGLQGWRRWYAVVSYEYEVDGRGYRNSRVSYQQPSDGRTSGDSMRYAESEFPIGSEREVRYDPRWPSRSVLIARPGDWGAVLWSAGVSGAAVVLVLVMAKARGDGE